MVELVKPTLSTRKLPVDKAKDLHAKNRAYENYDAIPSKEGQFYSMCLGANAEFLLASRAPDACRCSFEMRAQMAVTEHGR